jgi:23S rRNA (adenine2503-C2)-methyltransferase
MRYHYGNTVCISTEVGCRMGCAFCASTIGGLVRRLEPYEILDQVLFTQAESGLPISHIVLMGIGEPLDNFDNVMRFLELVNHPDGMNISMRHISLSTCGLVPMIDKLAEKKLQISLAISLHGPNDEIRNRIMPVNKAYPMDVLLAACRRYYEATSRRIHFEYAMIDGLNDREADARELLQRLKGLQAHVNMIPLNHVEESPLKPSTRQAVQRFQKILEDGGIPATVRRTLGGDIDASCGQLRRKYTKEKNG